ncbi:hypothetical protein FHS54_001964 [Sphingobium vermicomposti]|uniref:Uncharacterized protein n=1 Tax=Sphingobium vermicomposti TaxID=529005 RepID=A0A846MG17_9SPHN|nr:hypothetical protein [Sphingobium vermicomposti]
MIHGEQIEPISCADHFDPRAQKMLVPLQDVQAPFSTVRHTQDWIKTIFKQNAGQLVTGWPMHDALCSRCSGQESDHSVIFRSENRWTE